MQLGRVTYFQQTILGPIPTQSLCVLRQKYTSDFFLSKKMAENINTIYANGNPEILQK
jgi:hypothetical protein